MDENFETNNTIENYDIEEQDKEYDADVSESTAEEVDINEIIEQLPEAIVNTANKFTVLAAVSALVIIMLAIIIKAFAALLLLFIPAYFCYEKYEIVRDYVSGKIVGVEAICSSVKANPIKKELSVVFYSEDGAPTCYGMRVLGKTSRDGDFIVGCGYKIYFYESAPTRLVAYSTINKNIAHPTNFIE